MEQEEWRPVVGFEESHEISNFGRVRRKCDGYIYKHVVNDHRQSSVVVYIRNKKGSQSIRSVPRMMAMAFIGVPEGNHQVVYHKDGNRFNNRLDNLYWTENGTNMRTEEVYRKKAERMRSDEARANMSRIRKAQCATPAGRAHMKALSNKANMVHARKIICMETGVIYPSIKAAADSVGRHTMVVQRSLARAKRNTSTYVSRGGEPVFHFRYYNPEDWKPKERIWRPIPIPEIADKYEISNMGEVRTVATGYYRKTVWSDAARNVHVAFLIKGKSRTFTLGSLVANAFLPKQYGADCVIHRDGDLKNNCVTNLVRVPKKGVYTYPMSRAADGGGRPERPVECIETGELYLSITEAARKRQVSYQTVLCSCRRFAANMKPRCNKRIGKPVYHFRYADQ